MAQPRSNIRSICQEQFQLLSLLIVIVICKCTLYSLPLLILRGILTLQGRYRKGRWRELRWEKPCVKVSKGPWNFSTDKKLKRYNSLSSLLRRGVLGQNVFHGTQRTDTGWAIN